MDLVDSVDFWLYVLNIICVKFPKIRTPNFLTKWHMETVCILRNNCIKSKI